MSKAASTDYFNASYKAATGLDPATPAADRSYDAGAIAALAVAQAGSADKEAIRAAIRKIVDPKGTEVSAGPDGFKKALAFFDGLPPGQYDLPKGSAVVAPDLTP